MKQERHELSLPQLLYDDLHTELERRYGPGFAQVIVDGLRKFEAEQTPDCLFVNALAEICQDMDNASVNEKPIVDLESVRRTRRLAKAIREIHGELYRRAMAAYDTHPWVKYREQKRDPEKMAA